MFAGLPACRQETGRAAVPSMQPSLTAAQRQVVIVVS